MKAGGRLCSFSSTSAIQHYSHDIYNSAQFNLRSNRVVYVVRDRSGTIATELLFNCQVSLRSAYVNGKEEDVNA